MIHDHPIESIGSWSFSVKNVKMGFSLGVEIPPFSDMPKRQTDRTPSNIQKANWENHHLE